MKWSWRLPRNWECTKRSPKVRPMKNGSNTFSNTLRCRNLPELGRIPEKGVLCFPYSLKIGRKTSGRSDVNSMRTRKTIPCLHPPASWSSTPRDWPRTSRTIRKDRLYLNGLKRANHAMMRDFPASRARMFPLLMMSNHGRWRIHAQCDDISWTREALPVKSRVGMAICMNLSGLHPKDAAKRGIKNGDIVKIIQ